ncbi:MAG: M1 family aminopeptidase, partial [bacterium]
PWGSRYWWPCKDTPADKPDSVDVYVEYPSGYRLMSLGKLMSDTDIGGGRRAVHWKHMYPVATYLIAITCAQFNTAVDTWNYNSVSMPIYTYSLPSSPSFSEFRAYMPDVLTNLSNAFGLYPYSTEKAGNANYGWGGAMEHQTCSFYNPGFYDEWVIAHETGHQWWGDMITCRTFNHVWLNEGGASYAEPIHWEQQYGTAAYHYYMQTQKFLGEGTIYVEDPLTEDIFDGNLSYDKASWVWHMLRGTIGDEAFFQFIDDWYHSDFQYGAATTSDFGDVLSASVGEDMHWWVDQWIYGSGHPEYELSWECLPDPTKADSYDLTYYVEQIQDNGSFFTMPVRTIFQTTGATLDTTLWYGPTSLFQIVFADSITNIIIDPEEWVLREYSYAPFSFHLATVALPDGYLNVPYAETLQVVGGVGPYTWTKLSGDLPLGTYFDYQKGILYGTPTWKGHSYFTMKVTDSDVPANVDQRAFTVTILDAPPQNVLGDANGDDIVNITDAVYLIDYIFNGGPPPNPYWTGDVNCDSAVNITDAVFIIQYIFNGGPEPNC